jgi:energy-converting hydrogenase Eha subunit B
MLSFALYLIGSIVCIAGLAWIATLLGAAQTYVIGIAGIVFAMAIVAAVLQRRAVEPPAA